MKSVVMDIEPFGGLVIIVKVERESLICAHRREVASRLLIDGSPNMYAKNFAEAYLSRVGTMV
jgi:hypothetical protein